MNFANTGRPLVEKVLYLVAAIETNKRKKEFKNITKPNQEKTTPRPLRKRKCMGPVIAVIAVEGKAEIQR